MRTAFFAIDFLLLLSCLGDALQIESCGRRSRSDFSLNGPTITQSLIRIQCLHGLTLARLAAFLIDLDGLQWYGRQSKRRMMKAETMKRVRPETGRSSDETFA
jgi:hypothetical protein